jgi:phospholipase C
MDTRRDFIKKAAMLSGGAGFLQVLPASIQQAFAINPAEGSTYLDAEHVVILMQENRSFDHSYGSLQGVRGFNDPRAIRLPNNNPVWLQENEAGETYLPFRLNMKESNATWLGSLPHSWTNQVDARNQGCYDKWLLAKASGHKGYERVPLTLGFYNRQDIPFYYALADAFTVCDQSFCSSLTGTTPNRLYLWSGTIRHEQHPSSIANVSNGDVTYDKEAGWTTFPERLEQHGISWKVYQNEISLESGLTSEEEDWLANFTDNPLEWFKQYRVRFSPAWYGYMERMESILPGEIEALKEQLSRLATGTDEEKKLNSSLESKQALLNRAKERHRWSKENFDQLSDHEKNLHAKAFSTNHKDPHYRSLTSLTYDDNGNKREMQIPRGDVLYQFREDTLNGNLPTVSWIIGSSNFSDHPGSPWYGAWYVSEVLDILTKKPEVWKKTIFILCYDENDGYFDHVPPFVPPHPLKSNTGLVSQGIDTSVEYVTLEQDLKRTEEKNARESPIGLGYRVPLVIASPWSRGGAVCSEVFDHTSILQFLENFLSHKTGKTISEPNISSWRRAVCGDLTSVFRQYQGEKIKTPAPVEKESFYEQIHKAQFMRDPFGYKPLSKVQIQEARNKNAVPSLMPRQEPGTRPACPLPYELYVNGGVEGEGKRFTIQFGVGNKVFEEKSAGAPFYVYAYKNGKVEVRNYAVVAGDSIKDSWSIDEKGDDGYHFCVHGPNGFYREFKGPKSDPGFNVQCLSARHAVKQDKLTGDIELVIKPTGNKLATLGLTDHYRRRSRPVDNKNQPAGKEKRIIIPCTDQHGWYDFTIHDDNRKLTWRFAGRVETGNWTRTDPAMGHPS